MKTILDQLDNFFEQQKETEQKVFFFLPILLFGFLSYYFLYPITDENLNNALRTQQNLANNINSVKTENQNLRVSNTSLTNQIKQKNKELVVLNKQKVEVDNLIKKLSFLKFDITKWAEFYNDIPKISKKFRLVITKLDNIMFVEENNDKLVEKKMEIEITTVGNFVDFIKFMHSFENKKEFVKIKSIQIDGKKMLLIIDIYGAKL